MHACAAGPGAECGTVDGSLRLSESSGLSRGLSRLVPMIWRPGPALLASRPSLLLASTSTSGLKCSAVLVAARRPVVAALDSDSEAEDTVDEELKKSSLVESPPSKATRAEGLRPIRRRVARSGGAAGPLGCFRFRDRGRVLSAYLRFPQLHRSRRFGESAEGPGPFSLKIPRALPQSCRSSCTSDRTRKLRTVSIDCSCQSIESRTYRSQTPPQTFTTRCASPTSRTRVIMGEKRGRGAKSGADGFPDIGRCLGKRYSSPRLGSAGAFGATGGAANASGGFLRSVWGLCRGESLAV